MFSSLKFIIISGIGLCFVLLIPYLWLSAAFVSAFTSDAQIIDAGVSFLWVYVWVVSFMAIQLSIMRTFLTTGDAVCAMSVNPGHQFLFDIPFPHLFNHR